MFSTARAFIPILATLVFSSTCLVWAAPTLQKHSWAEPGSTQVVPRRSETLSRRNLIEACNNAFDPRKPGYLYIGLAYTKAMDYFHNIEVFSFPQPSNDERKNSGLLTRLRPYSRYRVSFFFTKFQSTSDQITLALSPTLCCISSMGRSSGN